jgi:esterase/lipase
VNDTDRSAELKQLAHDVRNALNGVAINLEVARGRADRGIDVAQIAPFIETAVQQLEAATRLHKRYTDIVSDSATQPMPHANRSATAALDNNSSRP